MITVQLTKGYTCLIDNEDAWLLQWKWHAQVSRWGVYAARTLHLQHRKTKTIRMARVIMGVSDPSVLVDHRDGNKLDNRRHNLRICTKAQNAKNRVPNRDSQTGIKGIRRKGSGWQARIRHNGRQMCLGTRKVLQQAINLYNSASRELHGEFGRQIV
jgi:hypothetical protein